MGKTTDAMGKVNEAVTNNRKELTPKKPKRRAASSYRYNNSVTSACAGAELNSANTHNQPARGLLMTAYHNTTGWPTDPDIKPRVPGSSFQPGDDNVP